MWRILFYVFILSFGVEYVYSVSRLCDNTDERQKTLSCTTQILGESHNKNDICKMEVIPANNPACSNMTFKPLMSNGYVGGVTLRPYVMKMVHHDNLLPYDVNHTVLNITFRNIKWKSMRFRFQDKYKDTRNHCRNIYISKDATIDDKSVLYYDCYWTLTDDRDGQSHTLDFEATYDDGVVNRGQYYFNVPTAESLSSNVKERNWKPFIYIEIFPSTMRLHIMPPPSELKITAYNITVMKQIDVTGRNDEKQQSTTIYLRNRTDDVIHDYNIVGENGLFYFSVIPMHEECVYGDEEGCKIVESPKIKISSEYQTLNICIASVTALIVATLFAYYIVLRVIRRYWCKDYKLAMAHDIPQPTKVLVIYSPINRLHAECVASFVTYLRNEYGFDIMYDGDISITSHGDPYIWAEEAFRIASHVMYIVGPKEQKNLYNNIYDKPLSAHRDVDVLLLSFIKSNRVSKAPKEVLNVFFEHSNGPVPVETRHDKVFFLLKDWPKFISFLSKNLLPKKQIMRTEKGRCFLEDLTRAKKLLSGNPEDVIIRCEKNSSDKKILL